MIIQYVNLTKKLNTLLVVFAILSLIVHPINCPYSSSFLPSINHPQPASKKQTYNKYNSGLFDHIFYSYHLTIIITNQMSATTRALKYYSPRVFSKYSFYKGYLIPHAPTRLSSGFNAFVKQKFGSQKTGETAPALIKKISAEWKNLPESERAKFKPENSEVAKHEQEIKDYEKKFIEPIRARSISLYNYYMKTTNDKYRQKNPGKRVYQYIKDVFADFSKLPSEEMESLRKKHEEYRSTADKSLKQLEEYLVPTSNFYNYRQYYKSQGSDGRNISSMKKPQLAKLKQEFNAAFKEFEDKVNKFVERRGLPQLVGKKILQGYSLTEDKKNVVSKSAPKERSEEQSKEKPKQKENEKSNDKKNDKGNNKANEKKKPAEENKRSKSADTKKTQ